MGDRRRVVMAGLLVLAAGGLAACSSARGSKAAASSGSSSGGTATAAASVSGPHVPNSPLGAQIQFALDLADGKVASSTYATHFSPTFLAAAPPAKLDQAVAQLQPAGPWTLDHFVEGPTTNSGVLIIKSPQGSRLKMSIVIDDGNHLITGLLYQPSTS